MKKNPEETTYINMGVFIRFMKPEKKSPERKKYINTGIYPPCYGTRKGKSAERTK